MSQFVGKKYEFTNQKLKNLTSTADCAIIAMRPYNLELPTLYAGGVLRYNFRLFAESPRKTLNSGKL